MFNVFWCFGLVCFLVFGSLLMSVWCFVFCALLSLRAIKIGYLSQSISLYLFRNQCVTNKI